MNLFYHLITFMTIYNFIFVKFNGDTMSKFIKSTLILLIGGFFTKLIGMFIRIIMSRKLGPEGMGIYSLMMPTFSLLIALSQFGFPISISKLISEKKRNNLSLMVSVIPITVFINLFLICFMFIFSKGISIYLLHEKRVYFGLICMGLTLPFISTSSILRGYFFGKERMVPHVLSNVVEDVSRLILLYFGIPYFLSLGIDKCMAFMIMTNVISESVSIFVLVLFLPRKININNFKFDKDDMKDIIVIGSSSTCSRIIGNIGYFLEPIILTSFLLYSGYSKDFIVSEYGIINGFVMPILLLPSFFTSAISHALLPSVSYAYSNGMVKLVKKKLRQSIIISLLVGIPCTFVFLLFPRKLLFFIYSTDKGINYIRFLSIPFILHYIQGPISACLQAMGKMKDLLMGTFFGIILKLIVLSLFSLFHIGLYGLLISIICSIVFTTLFDYFNLRKYINIRY